MTNQPPTLDTYIALAVSDLDEWMEAHPLDNPAEWAISQVAEDNTPPMTTVLFSLVVQDNSLAFEDSDVMSSEPFAVLFAAVRGRIEQALQKHIEGKELA